MKLPGRDLVAERLADLGDAERRLLARELKRGLEVEEDALGGLRAQVDGRAGVLHRADRGLEHQVELARLGEVAVRMVAGQLRRRLAAADVRVLAAPSRASCEVVGAEAPLAGPALDERVAEPGQVARRLPGARVLDDRRVERDDVVALLDHRPPPGADHVVLQQHAVVPVVVGVGDAAVDLRRREDQAAPLAERDDLVHGHRAGHWARAGYRAREHAALYASSCERNVTICSLLGYLGRDGRNGPAPARAPRRLDRLARGAGLAARRPRQPAAAAATPEALLSGTPILRVPCRSTSIAASKATRSR